MNFILNLFRHTCIIGQKGQCGPIGHPGLKGCKGMPGTKGELLYTGIITFLSSF